MAQPIAMGEKTFTKLLDGKSLDVTTLSKDSRLKSIDVKKADLDGDGKISGEKEMKALFAAVDTFDKDGNPATVRLVEKDGTPTKSQEHFDAIADVSNVAALRALAQVNGPRNGNDDIMHVGMRDINHLESDALKARAAVTGQRLVVVGGNSSTVKGEDGANYDLKNKTEILGFAKTLGLPDAQSKKIAEVIEKAPESGRDEVANIAREWAKAEKGGRIPSRLILSGHSVGGDFWGDRGSLSKDTIMDLASAMPRAAGQVEDLHMSGCYCLGRSTIEDWRAAFPNLKTVMAYDKKAPTSDGGAPDHQAAWEARTRGRTESLDRGVAHGSVTWSKTGGFDDGKPLEKLADVRARVTSSEQEFKDHFDGKKEVANHARGPLRDYYTALSQLIEHPDLPKADRKALEEKRKTTIRLIYFDEIVKGFSRDKSQTISDGYSAAGLKAPDFSKLGRKDALAEIDRVMKATDKSTDPKVVALRSELDALKKLDPSRISETWIP